MRQKTSAELCNRKQEAAKDASADRVVPRRGAMGRGYLSPSQPNRVLFVLSSQFHFLLRNPDTSGRGLALALGSLLTAGLDAGEDVLAVLV